MPNLAHPLASAILAGNALPNVVKSDPSAYDRLTHGTTGKRLDLLGSSSKIEAGSSVGILGTVLYMVPAGGSGTEACASATDGCRAACLAEDGKRMSWETTRRARRRRHAAFLADRNRFLQDLDREIKRHAKRADKAGKMGAVRLNGTTDLPWHRMPFTDAAGIRHRSVLHANATVRFYEYTKHPLRIATKGGVPANLHLTYSVNEREGSDAHAAEYLDMGYGAAVVVGIKRHDVPDTFPLAGASYPCHDGDAHDARFLDPAGSVTILAAKGYAKGEDSGFVRADPRL